MPTKNALDRRLIGGAALFGVGWGLSGFCPGPAVAALATGLTPVLAFVASMLAGMAVYAWFFDLPRPQGAVGFRERLLGRPVER